MSIFLFFILISEENIYQFLTLYSINTAHTNYTDTMCTDKLMYNNYHERFQRMIIKDRKFMIRHCVQKIFLIKGNILVAALCNNSPFVKAKENDLLFIQTTGSTNSQFKTCLIIPTLDLLRNNHYQLK